MNSFPATVLCPMLAGLALLTATLMPASGAEPSPKVDHEGARIARVRGEVLPLAQILSSAERDIGGLAIEVELERDDGELRYELELLLPDGRVIELEFDARTGELVKLEGARLELLARLRALIRRSNGHAQAEIRCGAVRLDTGGCRVTVDGTAVNLTGHEYRLLAFLMHHAERVVSRTELAEHLYAQDDDRDSNTIDVFMARLRRKLPENFIVTVRGLGFRVGGGA